LRATVIRLKREPRIAKRLTQMLQRIGAREPLNGAELTMPVPLHAERERQRGFNQAAILARLVSKESGLPIDDQVLRRIKATERHRAGMDAQDRNHSVQRAFDVVRPDSVEGRSLLLLDDVYTTGSTITAACSSLLNAGAKSVNVLTIARVGYH